MVAVLLLVSVFLMTVGVSEGSIISRILCKHCKYRCQKSYVLCKPFSFVGLRKNCGSTRNECWESCDRTVCWNAIFNTPINKCYQKWSCVFYQIISGENKKKHDLDIFLWYKCIEQYTIKQFATCYLK